jgi:hypothetical protein
MKRFMNKKVAAIGLAAGLALGAAGVATAYWTSSGSGTGTSSTTAGSSDLTYATTTINPMYPGDSAQNFTVTVTNNSATQKEYVNGVSAYITTNKSGCDGSDFLLDGVATAVSSATAVPLAWTAQELTATTGAPANAATTAAATDTIQFNDKLTNQDACKSAVVTLNYTSSL